jgi:hypothetical protein
MLTKEDLAYFMCIQRHVAMLQMQAEEQNDLKRISIMRVIYDDIARCILWRMEGKDFDATIFDDIKERLSLIIGQESAEYWMNRLKQESLST